MRLLLRVLLAALLAAPAAARHPAAPSPSPLEPAASGGLEAVDRALAKLSTHRRLLVVGAHPDDEDTTLLALVARGLGGEAAYLSLSRGEGGQNLIGPELGTGLGLLRTGELLAARRIEGSRQLFTRAFDFGYTRSLEEALERWPLEVLDEDAVRMARRFKPQVVVSVFPPDGRAGHGQHQAAAVVARDLFELAGEPGRFPALDAEGVRPWRPEALYLRTWWDPEATTAEVPLDLLDPFTGRSMYQLAAASRSMHRSQDMGRTQPVGPRSVGLGWVAGGAGSGGTDLFSGIDTRLAALAATLPDGEARDRIEERLAAVEGRAREARGRLSPVAVEAAAPDLAEILASLREARGLLAGAEPEAAASVVAELLDEKIAVAEAGLAAAAGVVAEARADRDAVAAGEVVTVTLELWNTGGAALSVRSVELLAEEGWRPGAGVPAATVLEPGGFGSWEREVAVAAGEPPTVPYFLRRPLDGDLYDWSGVDGAVAGEPFQPPPLTARFELEIHGAVVALEREVVHVHGDQAVGEVRRPLRAVPRLEVAVEPAQIVWPIASGGGRSVEVALASRVASPLAGRLEIAVPEGWPPVPPVPFAIEEPRGRLALALEIRAPESFGPGRYPFSVAAVLDGGERFAAAVPLVEYPHVSPYALPRQAEVEVRGLRLELPRLGRLGYVRGASDRVPEALLEIGLPLELLGPHELLAADLASYDVIVVGSRAYETEPVLARANRRLLDYVRAGGVLVVQYQQYQFVEGGYAPYRLTIGRPHGRVTDEGSPVRPLVPDHPVFRLPNAIAEGDWAGWVQERGLYFAAEWETPFFPLLAMHDEGQSEQAGALLLARVGQGAYVYTGLSFFRQLPAGVPGAFRLFANLLALGETW